MDHWNCPVPSQVTWENNQSPLNEMHIHQQNHWNDTIFYWYHWYQWTISLTNHIRLCILDMCVTLKPFIYIPIGLGKGGGGYSWEFFLGGVPPGSPNPDTISDQKYVILLTCFQTRPPKSIPVFRPVLWAPDLAFRQKLRHHYLDSVCKQKNSSNAFQIRIFLLLSYSFGIETISTFIHSHSTLENHTWFQTKMVKVYTCFQTKTRPGGAAHTYIACIRE